MQWSLQLAQRKQKRFMVFLVSKTRSLNVRCCPFITHFYINQNN
jgi:hypothetical protein